MSELALWKVLLGIRGKTNNSLYVYVLGIDVDEAIAAALRWEDMHQEPMVPANEVLSVEMICPFVLTIRDVMLDEDTGEVALKD